MRRHDHRRLLVTVLAAFVLAATIHAQLATIPEQLAREGRSLSAGPSIPSGLAPPFDRILGDTDVIVRGLVGEPRSYLSDDQLDVYTDYPLINPVVLYQSALVTATKPGMPTVIVTLLGGRIMINGLTFTSTHEALPSLEPGEECLFLLKRIGDRYRVAVTYFGVFRIAGEKLTPLVKISEFASEYRDAPAGQAAAEMVARLRTLRR